jgi:glycosyltransferase involved in cell wall biosynthesis
MHIVLYHDALIPPPRYGGTERIVYWLAKALAEIGHQVTLIAKEKSHVPGVELIPLAKGDASSWEKRIPESADVLHLWATPQTLPKKPFLVTIEGNGQPLEKFHNNTVFVSRKHAELHGSTHFVYNGIDPSEYPCDEKRENYLVFLAKASWKVKNLEGAIEVARQANLPLKVIGSKNWPFQIQRLFSNPWSKVQYLGMLGDSDKRKILRKARALLFPVRWHEPFGIAITEALASGCAVYGTPYGSLPEIVTPEVGFLSNQAGELADAIHRQVISPQIYRNRVHQGFTHLQMAQTYLDFYQKILAQGSLESRVHPPQWKEPRPAQALLSWN